MLLLIVINGAAAALCPLLLPLIFGKSFAEAVPVAMYLLLANTFKGVRQVMDYALRATLHTRISMLSESIGLVGFIVFAPIGSEIGGLIGIALAMVGAQVLALGVMVVGMARLLNLYILDLWGGRPSTVLQLIRVAVQEFQAIQARRPR
jgi:O-antigen/teichoic acid export membrane protein